MNTKMYIVNIQYLLHVHVHESVIGEMGVLRRKIIQKGLNRLDLTC